MNREPLFDDVGEPENTVLSQVRAGMRVVDVAGNEIGTVDDVKMGNLEAATPAGSTTDRGGPIIDIFAAAFGAEPDVPEAERAQLLRYGYIKVDGSGLGSGDWYVRGDRVRAVSDDTVTLSVGKDALINE